MATARFEPAVTVLDLQDGAYVETARASGSEVVEPSRPFPVRLVPADLLA